VGLPLALAAKFILNGQISSPGVHIPVQAEFYGPVLKELEELGIALVHTTSELG
jgi:saccharopine dehydrogenase (NAD+, L-glutamate forming)